MNEASKKARRPAGYRPFWESEEEEEMQPEKPSMFAGLKERLIGGKTAAEVATEEAEKLKKKKESY